MKAAKYQKPEGREGAIERLNTALDATSLAEKVSSIAPAKIVFGSVGILLAQIRDSTVDEPDYVELGLFCADICRRLDQGTNGKKPDELELSLSVYGAINQLSVTVADIARKFVKFCRRNAVFRHFQAKKNKETIAAWRLSLEDILQVFNEALPMETDSVAPAVSHDATNSRITVSGVENDIVNTPAVVSDGHRSASKRPEDAHGQNRMPAYASAPGESSAPLPGSTHGIVSDVRQDIRRPIAFQLERNATNTWTMVSEIHRNIVKGQEPNYSRDLLTQTSIPGESPPFPPRTLFGRNELIEKVVDLAERLTPIALIGAGGIGKTSIALTVLHHDRIKQRFGHDRRFIRCDRFPASSAHLLQRLSDIVGAGVQNPENLAPLRKFLSSKEMLIVLDNAESILDPRGTDAWEIYNVVEELSRFRNICVCITSRISTVPPDCKYLSVPTLSVDAAQDTFYHIYDSDADRSDAVNGILKQLDSHPLSIVLLATAAHKNQWDTRQLTREWEQRRTGVLQTQHDESLATAIELSLASPLFRELGPDARALLGVVAFFPQGIDENNLERLFPTISNRTHIFDRFCNLSLTYRSDGFVAMLAPLRGYLFPEDPKTSPLLLAIKEHYFTRMSVDIDPNMPNFEETQWITSEDVNVEHLLDVFTTIDADSDDTWHACANFMKHLFWHKKRLTILKQKIKDLPDDHRSKPGCLFWFTRLLISVGNDAECRQLLTHALNLWRAQGSDRMVASTSMELSNVDQVVGLHKEAIQQAREASKIFERLGDTVGQAGCLIYLAWSLSSDDQLDAAEESAFHAINLLPEEGEQHQVSESHRALANIYQSKGDIERAIHHFEVALGIASAFNWHDVLFWLHYELAGLFRDGDRFDDAHAHIEHAKSHTANSAYRLGLATRRKAWVWYDQHRLEEAKSEALRAADVYEKIGAAKDVEDCRRLLRYIEKELNTVVFSGNQTITS